jgi:outer membrane protein assembly factor BamB
VWGSPAIDVDAGRVFFGTGSCGTEGVEVGEDAFAVDLRTGALAWHFDTPRVNEDWDDDYGASPNLLPGGRVGFGSKDGSYYALDRSDGDVAWVAHVGQSGHLTDGFAVGGIIGTPAVGLVGGRPAVFTTTALSTPIAEPLDEGHPDAWIDTTLAEDPGRLLSLSAVDAATGRVLWRSPLARQSYGAPTYADGVVLVPSTFSAELLAFHADTGLLLSAMPVVGAPSSSPTVVGDTIYLGGGTRTSDLEFKAFGASAAETLLGASPLSPASGLFAYRIALGRVPLPAG